MRMSIRTGGNKAAKRCCLRRAFQVVMISSAGFAVGCSGEGERPRVAPIVDGGKTAPHSTADAATAPPKAIATH
jgi:hypothetical protein